MTNLESFCAAHQDGRAEVSVIGDSEVKIVISSKDREDDILFISKDELAQSQAGDSCETCKAIISIFKV